jgi:glycosyltransferase involved in cell wall biosynthesis
MTRPLVSIIIPTYNYAHLIAETLLSVCRQTYSNWECIIIDDGSTDQTAEIIARFLEQHPKYNFRYIYTSNAGTSAAKNEGIRLAKGTFIQFLDADDLLSPEKLDIQVRQLEDNDSVLVFSSSRFFSIIGEEQCEQEKYPEGFLAISDLKGYELFKRLITNNIVTISSPLVRTGPLRSIGGFDTALLNNEDWMLWFKIALIRPYFKFDGNPRSSVQIRIHRNSAMNQHQQMFLGEVVVRKEMERLLQQQQFGEAGASLLKLNKDLLALHRVRSLEIGKGMSHIIGSFIKHPISEYRLLSRGLLKLAVRVYKSIIHS